MIVPLGNAPVSAPVDGFGTHAVRPDFTSRSSLGRAAGRLDREPPMIPGTYVLILVILLLIGSVPAWPYSRRWGYGPSGVLGVVLIVLLLTSMMQPS
jgi:hypothetical protein